MIKKDLQTTLFPFHTMLCSTYRIIQEVNCVYTPMRTVECRFRRRLRDRSEVDLSPLGVGLQRFRVHSEFFVDHGLERLYIGLVINACQELSTGL